MLLTSAGHQVLALRCAARSGPRRSASWALHVAVMASPCEPSPIWEATAGVR